MSNLGISWEVDFSLKEKRGKAWARNQKSRTATAREWHWVETFYLRSLGITTPVCGVDKWELDKSHSGNTGRRVWCRNLASKTASAREWHWASPQALRNVGVQIPFRSKDSWEADWSKRSGFLVWARNLNSKIASARSWHWTQYMTLKNAGVKCVFKRDGYSRSRTTGGYVFIRKGALTTEERSLAELSDLFKGSKSVAEHRLEAAKKYGRIPHGHVVRHKNGIKSDNRHENLILGTHQENVMDHETARLEMMIWREKYQQLEASLRKSA